MNTKILVVLCGIALSGTILANERHPFSPGARQEKDNNVLTFTGDNPVSDVRVQKPIPRKNK